jgi:predicted HD phosphohydrolase
MNQPFSIVPPLELVQEWMRTAPHLNNQHEHYHYITLCAAQWGANQELEACCLLLDDGEHAASYGCHNGTSLRAARRPKPPRLKEQALKALQNMDHMNQFPNEHDYSTIRRALEALPND